MHAPGASKVLVADDTRDSADTLALLLDVNGFETRAVYDGRAAVELADSWHPDCAVLDLTLKGMSGFDVARHLRREFGPGIRLVACTGWAADKDREEALAAGFDDVVVKPPEPSRLLEALSGEGRSLVARSAEVSLRQLGSRIDLGHSLLDRSQTKADVQDRRRILEFVRRALEQIRLAIATLPIAPVDRDALEKRVANLNERLADLES